jgi:uncharacterized repeat protein (TIGR02543 family)
MGPDVFASCATGFTVWYVSGTAGWTNPWHTYPTAVAYTLTFNVTGSGSVARSPDASSYALGAVVTLTAAPAAGYGFSGWSGHLAGTVNPTTVVMNGNKTVTATFTALPSYILTTMAFPSSCGTVEKSPSQSSYLSGTVVTLTSTPATGYTFTGWSGDLTGHANPAALTMSGNKTVTASFAVAASCTLSVIVAGSGFVVKSPNMSSYPCGTVVTLTATPTGGDPFSGWSGDLTGTTNPTTVTMNSDKTVTATFSPALVLSSSWNLVSVPIPLPASSVPGLLSVYGYHDGWSVPTTLTPGEGYWVQVQNAVTVPLAGTPSTAPIALTYQAGWQLLGNPFDVPLPVSTITNHGLIVTCYSYGPAWGVLNLPTDSLQPGKGYWVNLSAATTLTLTHP